MAKGDSKGSDQKAVAPTIQKARNKRFEKGSVYFVGLTTDAPSHCVPIPMRPGRGALMVPRSSGMLTPHPVQEGAFRLNDHALLGTHVTLTDEEVVMVKKFAREHGLWVDAMVSRRVAVTPGRPADGEKTIKIAVNKFNRIVRLDGEGAERIIGPAVADIPERAIPIENVMWLMPREDQSHYNGVPPVMSEMYKKENTPAQASA